ncbi:MAG: carboxypeptidase regulatory-like domain-containing protein [Acidobacteria bacterium]|nr:carboxypeptidase regulatory-like domain-containing protein [Acidobacteriota bacterium]
MIRYWSLVLLCASCLSAQTITGSITGTIKDSSGLAVVGAPVTLIQEATGAVRQAKSGERGDFVFGALQPGEYRLEVTQTGFKKAERRGIMLSAATLLAVGDIVLEVGAVSEAVTVTAQGVTVQTASAERAGVITSNQVENLLIRGRSVMSLLELLPGVVNLQDSESIDRNWNLNVNGNRRNTSSVQMDGATMNAIGNNFNAVLGVSQDAVAEVKVLLSNYQAEYGRMSGANISLVTKSGTREFHGLGSYFKRHEQFNANNFFNSRLGQQKPRYRFNTWNYSVGGPVYIPGKFNRNRDKLFFFFSEEYWPLRAAQPITQLTTPTEAERVGDFSQSLDLNGRVIAITDPDTKAAFPGNRIPANRLNPNGVALLKFQPLPNFFDRSLSAGRYNYVFQTENKTPQRMETLKLDHHINSNNVLFGNFSMYSDVQEGSNGISSSGGTNWPQMRKTFNNQGKLWLGRYTRIFSPTLINELNVAFSHRPADDIVNEEELRRNQRDTVGFNMGQFNPSSNPLKVVPNATFGGVTNPANLTIEGRFPLVTTHDIFSLTDSVTKTLGTHTIKAGFYADRFWRNAANAVNFNGSFDFGRNVNNPLETGYAYSNAALGIFNSYTEASNRPFLHFRLSNIEWFAQDNWKVTRRLTLDFGLRFYWIQPIFDQDNLVSAFAPERFDASKQVKLVAPALVGGRRVGVNPVNGEVLSATFIGAIAPGSGDAANGLVTPSTDPSYPRALMKNRGVQYAPRIGFAYDPTGKGKTAIRAGFGIFYNRQNLDAVLNPFSTQAPLVQNPVIYFGTLSTLLSSTGVLFPQNILGMDRQGLIPSVMNFSFSIQQNIGFGTVVDAGYVGSLGRHLMWQRNLNAVPFGANFDPANADPSNPRTPLPRAFLGPIAGYNNVNYREFAATSNYNSLQVTVNRRFRRGFQFGAAWTWSKAMDFNDNDTDSVSTLVPVRVWNYGLASFDRTHILKANWLWDVPKTPWKEPVLKMVFNGWQVSGIATFISGAPLGIGYGTTVATDTTGSPTDGARIVVTDNPVLPKCERSFSRNFRTEVFQVPQQGTIGNAARSLIRGPGINNWDTAVFKNFPIREPIRLQFRWEMYNAFNHTQFSGLDTTARFDPTGKQTNARFGEFTTARNPRQMQFALRFYF